MEYEDSYKSLKEALTHGAIAQNLKLKIHLDRGRRSRIAGPDDRSYEAQLEGFDGILVPGGFGKRGIEGMLNAIRYAREKNVPYFGICLGMQTACIEFARNVCGLKDANSSEFDPATAAPHHLQAARTAGRGRDGRDDAPGRLDLHSAGGLAGQPRLRRPTEISERHRHRYEFNREYEALLTGGGLRITGTTPDADLCRDRRDPRPSVLPRLPVPSRIQIQAARAAPALPRVHHRQLQEPLAALANRVGRQPGRPVELPDMSWVRGTPLPQRYIYLIATLVASAIIIPFQGYTSALYVGACAGYSVLVFGLRRLAMQRWKSVVPAAIGQSSTAKILLTHANFLALVIAWIWSLIALAPHVPYILRTEDSDRPYLGLAFFGVLGLLLLEMFEQRFLRPELNPGYTWGQIGSVRQTRARAAK